MKYFIIFLAAYIICALIITYIDEIKSIFKRMFCILIMASACIGCSSSLPERTFIIKEVSGVTRTYELYHTTDTALLIRNVEFGTVAERKDAFWMPMGMIDTIWFDNMPRSTQQGFGAIIGMLIVGGYGIALDNQSSSPIKASGLLGGMLGGAIGYAIGSAIPSPTVLVYPPMYEEGQFLRKRELYKVSDDESDSYTRYWISLGLLLIRLVFR